MNKYGKEIFTFVKIANGEMIVLAVNTNNIVFVYNEKKELAFQKPGILHSYSEHYVAVKSPIDGNDTISIFDESGSLVGTHPKDFIDNNNIAGVFL